VLQYKYLGDMSSIDQSYPAARATFAHRLANKLKHTLGRLFAYNRVTLQMQVATKMQLLGTLMLGATSYLVAVHALSAMQLECAEAPVRRALMEILGLPARGALAVAAMMEAPAVVPFTALSLTHRVRLLYTLYTTPHYADSPPASLVRRATGARDAPRERPGGACERVPIPADLPVANAVIGFTFPRDTLRELSGAVAPVGRFGALPSADWRQPTSPRAIIPAVHRLRVTMCFHQLGSTLLAHWTQRRAWPLADAAVPAGDGGQPSRAQPYLPPPARAAAAATRSMPVYRTSSRNDPDPRYALVGRPPADQLGHLSALYYAPSHALPRDAAPSGASSVTYVSWTGPGGAGRFLALSQLPTRVVARVARLRLGNRCLQLAPFARYSDRIMPLTERERDAVCDTCRKEAPAAKLMLCNGVCGRALHWSSRCAAQASDMGSIAEYSGAAARRKTRSNTAPLRAAAAAPLLASGAGPMPKRWFCSRACKTFHDDAVAADALTRAEEAETRAGAASAAPCQLCIAAGGVASDAEDIWHLLFTCEHPAMVAIRGDMRLSAISHFVALSEALLAAVERALVWFPGDALQAAEAALAVGNARRVAQEARDAGTGLDAHCLYRLVMALPFSARAIPPPRALQPLSTPAPAIPPPTQAPPPGRRGALGGTGTEAGGCAPARKSLPADQRRRPRPASPPRRSAEPPPPPPSMPADEYAASRALGRVYDSVRLPNAVLRPAANRAVSWASMWIRTIAEARRAVLFPAPPEVVPRTRPAPGRPLSSTVPPAAAACRATDGVGGAPRRADPEVPGPLLAEPPHPP